VKGQQMRTEQHIISTAQQRQQQRNGETDGGIQWTRQGSQSVGSSLNRSDDSSTRPGRLVEEGERRRRGRRRQGR
jgi:hypothetical protein